MKPVLRYDRPGMGRENPEGTSGSALGHRIRLDRAEAAVLVAALLLGVGVLGLGFFEMFLVGERDFDLASTGISAESYLRFGFKELRLAPLRSFPQDSEKPLETSHVYLNRPAVLPLAVGMARAIFGREEWVVRLPMLLAGPASILLLFLLLRRHYSAAAVAGGMVCFLATPMFFVFGRSIAFEAMALPGVLAALLGYAWSLEDRRKGTVLCALGLAAGTCFDWFPILLLPFMTAGWWLHGSGASSPRRLGRTMRKGALAALAPGSVLALHISHVVWVAGSLEPLLITIRTRSYGEAISEGAEAVSWARFLEAIPQHLWRYYLVTGVLLLVGGLAVALHRRTWRGGVHPWLVLASAQVAWLLLFRNWAVIHGQYLYYSLPLLAASAAAFLDLARRKRRLIVVSAALTAMHPFAGIVWSTDYLSRQEVAPSLTARALGAMVGEDEQVLANLELAPSLRYYIGAPVVRVRTLEEARELSEAHRFFVSLPLRADPPAVEIHRWLEEQGYPAFGLTYVFVYLLAVPPPPPPRIRWDPDPPWWWRYLGSPIHAPVRLEPGRAPRLQDARGGELSRASGWGPRGG